MKSGNPSHRQLLYFISAIVVLAIVLLGVLLGPCSRCTTKWRCPFGAKEASADADATNDSITQQRERVDSLLRAPRFSRFTLDEHGKLLKQPVKSVTDFSETFPDLNPTHLATAERIGIRSCADRNEAALRDNELVYIGDNPYYHVRPLGYSIPYLVPRAATLLEEIGRSFLDSLTSKGYAFRQLVVTSVLRTQDDVRRLRRHNRNAAATSAHSFGTTFDIAYTHFNAVPGPRDPSLRTPDPYTLKCILAEVLRDQRLKGTCYVKYEVHQSCFHITAR